MNVKAICCCFALIVSLILAVSLVRTIGHAIQSATSHTDSAIAQQGG